VILRSFWLTGWGRYLALVTILAGGIAFLATRPGDGPHAGPASPPPAEVPNFVSEEASGADSGRLSLIDLPLSLMGAHRHSQAEGCDQRDVAQFFATMEADYRRRGFVRSPDGNVTSWNTSPNSGIYWRRESNGFQLFGVSDASAKGRTAIRMTLGSATAACPTKWSVYEYTPSTLNGNRSEPINDNWEQPAPLPVPPDAREVVCLPRNSGGGTWSYETERKLPDLRKWYQESLAPGWQLRDMHPTNTGDASLLMLASNRDTECLLSLQATTAPQRSSALLIICGISQ
jgi:hypothetical protein